MLVWVRVDFTLLPTKLGNLEKLVDIKEYSNKSIEKIISVT